MMMTPILPAFVELCGRLQLGDNPDPGIQL